MKINGKNTELKTELTLHDFLKSQNYDLSKIAVELNGKIIQKKEYEYVMLSDRDAVEIVCFVGGG